MSKVAVIGLGYVGLPLAVRAAEVGHEVVGFDVDFHKIDSLCMRHSYIEDISDSRLESLTSFTATRNEGDLRDFDLAIITVPTPLRDGSPDLSYVEGAAHTVGRYLNRNAVVVLESTTYPGTTENLVADTLFITSGLRPGDYHLGFSPERIDPGNPTFKLETTPKIVSGTTPAALKVIDEFYSGIVNETVPVSSPKVAELAKLLENTFRHVNIALVNEMAVLAHEMGINVWDAIDAAATKPFGFMKFTPGPGVGGHCLPIDPEYLSWAVRRELDKSFRFVELAVDINNHMPDYVVGRANDLLNQYRKPVNGAKVLILGVAYKAGTSDVRESPAQRIIELLTGRGAEVSVADPYVVDWDATPYVDIESLYGRVDEFDLVIVVTAHDEFNLTKIADKAQLILDCRNAVEPADHITKL